MEKYKDKLPGFIKILEEQAQYSIIDPRYFCTSTEDVTSLAQKRRTQHYVENYDVSFSKDTVPYETYLQGGLHIQHSAQIQGLGV